MPPRRKLCFPSYRQQEAHSSGLRSIWSVVFPSTIWRQSLACHGHNLLFIKIYSFPSPFPSLLLLSFLHARISSPGLRTGMFRDRMPPPLFIAVCPDFDPTCCPSSNCLNIHTSIIIFNNFSLVLSSNLLVSTQVFPFSLTKRQISLTYKHNDDSLHFPNIWKKHVISPFSSRIPKSSSSTNPFHHKAKNQHFKILFNTTNTE